MTIGKDVLASANFGSSYERFARTSSMVGSVTAVAIVSIKILLFLQIAVKSLRKKKKNLITKPLSILTLFKH